VEIGHAANYRGSPPALSSPLVVRRTEDEDSIPFALYRDFAIIAPAVVFGTLSIHRSSIWV